MADRVSYAHATTCPAVTRADKFFHIAAKPLAAVLLNQLQAPLLSNMAVWDGAVPGVASTRFPSEELATDISNDTDRVGTGAPAHQSK
jgi:hypothetical protein